MSWVLAGAFGLGMLACAPQGTAAKFEPVASATTETIKGAASASYDLTTPKEQLGDVKVWSEGATLQGNFGTQISVGFRVTNRSDRPIQLDTSSIRLVSVDTKQGDFAIVQPAVASESPIIVAPNGGITQSHLTFQLPQDVHPSDVRGFRVLWTARAATGEEFTHRTPFLVQGNNIAAIPVTDYNALNQSDESPYTAPRFVLVTPDHRIVVEPLRRAR